MCPCLRMKMAEQNDEQVHRLERINSSSFLCLVRNTSIRAYLILEHIGAVGQ
jgi:hypothetical protein